MNELAQALDEFVKGRNPSVIFPAKVTGVNEDLPGCNVVDSVGNEYFDVRLQAKPMDGLGTYILPKFDSWVLVGRLEKSDALTVLMFSEIDQMRVETGNVIFRQLSNGFLFQKSSDTLAAMMSDFMDAMQALTVTCAAPGSPSSPPVNLATFAALKIRFNSILKTS